jgi:hypothetical protein
MLMQHLRLARHGKVGNLRSLVPIIDGARRKLQVKTYRLAFQIEQRNQHRVSFVEGILSVGSFSRLRGKNPNCNDATHHSSLSVYDHVWGYEEIAALPQAKTFWAAVPMEYERLHVRINAQWLLWIIGKDRQKCQRT